MRKSSSHTTLARSRLFVGSSSRMMSGEPNSACASSTLTFRRGSISRIIVSWKSGETPRPWSMRLASDSASQPPSSANSSSSSAARMPSASSKSGLSYIASFSLPQS